MSVEIKAEPHRTGGLSDLVRLLPTAVMLLLQELCYWELLDTLANWNLILEHIKNK